MSERELAQIAYEALALIRAGNTAAAVTLLEKTAGID